MQKRPVPIIFLYQVLTFGFYFVYWCWRSKNEVNKKLGKQVIPSTWWFALPFGGYWWAWQYSQAVEKVTKGKLKYADTFGLFLIATLGVIGSLWFPIPDVSFDVKGSLFQPIWIIFGAGLLLIAILFLGIFPAAMQGRFNKLSNK